MKLKALVACAALACSSLYAQTIAVKDAWVRATVPGQMASGAFMKITAKDGARLVSVSSPLAGVAEVHEMKLEGDVMKMQAVAGGLELPPGKTVELKPGGYHVMLMDLKAPLKTNSKVPMTLTFKNAKGVQSKVELKLPVSLVPPAAKTGEPAGMADHGNDHRH
jgi:copper(I)-binding protein